MNVAAQCRALFTGRGAAARIAGSALLVATVATQHPNPVFNRLQLRDHFSVLPNWKFFAPNPATHDYHYLFRTLDVDGETSRWQSIELIADRRMHQAFWFATRRGEKAVFDVCSEILQRMDKGFEVIKVTASYRLLVNFIRREIAERSDDLGRIKGFQISMVRASGHDPDEEPEILFVSPYVGMDGADERRLVPVA
ncbi:hypothetical protein [Nesterenkonia xinjiangensis]|uniref:Uncharacterized protein n=1 Tax=Nesterenkonia xinjiangensis TaxID=225327 RepID=A0A7Z0GL29_9MICC|nr:hypothetical protein [Nesterenkonia xinjiangensis]NYJ77987.1 hypothetical protein [Nesterenkonia xinjiangensis]